MEEYKNTYSESDFSIYMTDDEIEESRKIRARVNDAATYLDEEKEKWATLEQAYLGDQPEKEGVPNTRVNIILANVEGQAGELASQDVSVSCIGQSPNDHEFAEDAKVNLEWDIRHQEDLYGTAMDASRSLLGLGTMAFKTSYDPFAFDEFGIPRIEAPNIDRIVFDPKVTSYRRTQDAEFIAEYISMSRTEAERMWGEEKAGSIQYGKISEEELIFKSDFFREDDDSSWTLIQYWSKDEGKLRLREFAHCGLLLYDSFKGDDRKENQKSNKKTPNSYYTFVNDRYPYVFRTLYPRRGKFYGKGDAELILKLQDMLNNLYDCIRVQARPPLILVDDNTDLDPAEMNKDSFTPMPYNSDIIGTNNRNPVYVVNWGVVNDAWWRLIAQIHEEVQRVLRYSNLMMGMNSNAQSATEAAIQQQQGGRATNMKQKIIEGAMSEAINYCLGLDLQFRTGVKSMRLQDDKPGYHDVNFDRLKAIPVMTPVEESVKKMYTDNGNEAPDMQILQKHGKDVTKSVALDIKINIGAGLPKSPSFLADLANKLSAMVIPDKQGQARPVMGWEEYRKFLRDFVGFPLEDDETMAMAPPVAPSPDMGGENMLGTPSALPNPDATNLSPAGRPTMAQLNQIRGRPV